MLRGVDEGLRTKWRLYKPLVWLQLAAVVFFALGSLCVLYLQNRSAIESAARFVQLKEDQRDMFALIYKQDFLHSLTLNIVPMGCTSPVPGAQSVPMWADRLPRLFKELTGRLPAQNETAVLQLFVRYGSLKLLLSGQANSSAEQWFYSVGSDENSPSELNVAAAFPSDPGLSRVASDLVDLRLSDQHLRQFMTNPPSIKSILQSPIMTSQFDPRSELGFFRVVVAGLYAGSYDVRIPPANLDKKSTWVPVKVPLEYLRCWNVILRVNGRLIASAMTSDLEKEISHFPGPMIGAEYLEGLMWLVPSPEDWRELRPLMNCRVAWLLYADTKLPCH